MCECVLLDEFVISMFALLRFRRTYYMDSGVSPRFSGPIWIGRLYYIYILSIGRVPFVLNTAVLIYISYLIVSHFNRILPGRARHATGRIVSLAAWLPRAVPASYIHIYSQCISFDCFCVVKYECVCVCVERYNMIIIKFMLHCTQKSHSEHNQSWAQVVNHGSRMIRSPDY